MALQVWLPFIDGTLTNNGLKSLTLTSNNTSVQNNGKLGKCLNFNGSSSIITSTEKVNIIGDTSYTIAFWMYWAGDTWTNDYVGIVGWGQMSTNQGAWAIIHNGKPDLDFWNRRYEATTQLQVKRWYHITMVKTPGNMSTTSKLYVDGQEVPGTPSSTETPSIVDGTLLIGRLNNSSTRWFNGYLNDIRIYDEALSPLEIKRIAQGLILHYPLDNNGFGNENLAIKTGERVPDASNQVEWRGFKLGNLSITTNETLTVSFDLKMVIGTAVNGYPYLLVYNTNYKGPHGQWIYVSNNSTNKMIPSGNYVVGDIIKRRVSVTITTPSSFTAGSQTEDWIEFYSNYSTENEITITNIKVERGNKATPWVPAKTDDLGILLGLNDTIEYDCSGYCNNGIIMGTLNVSTDTPRYNISTYFPNTTTTTTFDDKCWITTPFILNNINQLTVSFWFKKEAITRGGLFTTNVATYTGTDLTIDDYDNSVKIRASDGTSVTLGSYDNLIPASTWCHWVVTFDGINVKVYVNSILKNTVSYSATKMLKNITNITLGANKAGGVHRTAKGNYSDFRIYATVLSADDVKALYENSAYIATDGTSYAYEYVEV